MEIVTILIVVLLILLALALVVYPLWQQTRPEALFQVNRAGQTLEEYQARYQATLAAIKDLMFDHEMGKVSEEDYQALLAKAKLEAAAYRQEIERLAGNPETIDTALDAQIEALITQTRGSAVNGNSELLHAIDTEIELLKQARAPRSKDGGLTCPNCAHPLLPGDAFCAGCGQSLRDAAAGDANFCPACGAPTQPTDSFCVRCGHALTPTIQISSS